MTYSLQRLLVILGLVIVPFYELIFRMFPFVKVMAPDTRASKEQIALVFALSIGLLAVFQGSLKPFRNKFALLIPIYLLFNLFMAPHADLFINEVECGDLYFWKPFVQVLCFALMIFAVASMEDGLVDILKTMVICGTIMSVYIILQSFGFDQFYLARTEQNFTGVPSMALGGNLGQPTVASSFLVLIVPLTFYLRKYWMAALIILAIILTKSNMALLSLILISILSLGYSKRQLIKPLIVIATILTICFGLVIHANSAIRHSIVEKMTGRTEVWKNIFTDIRDGALEGNKQDFSITGVGFGRFSYVFPGKHKSIFHQAHNEPLEWAYDCGIVGLGLLGMALYTMFSKIRQRGASLAILLSFASLLFISLGTFPFQLGAHQFYSAVLVGLLHNNQLRSDYV